MDPDRVGAVTRAASGIGGAPVAVVRVGVIASRELVLRIMRTADGWIDDRLMVTLVPIVYETEEEAAALIEAHRDGIDAALFAGPLSHDLAQAGGRLAVPAAHLSLSGSALHAALLRLVVRGVQDLQSLSIDSLDLTELTGAFQETGLDPERVIARPYSDPSDAASFLDFHRSVAARCAAALTSLPSVAQRLAAEGIVVELLHPTDASIRAGVREAALRGAGRALGQVKPAVAVVVVGRDPGVEQPSSLESASRAHTVGLVRAVLSRLCAEKGLALAVVGDRGFALHATRGLLPGSTLAEVSHRIAARVEKEVGVVPTVGVGVGNTPLEAERAAFRRIAGASERLSENAAAEPREQVPVAARGVSERIALLFSAVAVRGLGADTVDATDVAAVLDVSERTAARILNDLVEDGRAWPLPSDGTGGRGRPRRVFRLILPRRDESVASASAATPA